MDPTGYLWGLFPLAVGHILVPPISHFRLMGIVSKLEDVPPLLRNIHENSPLSEGQVMSMTLRDRGEVELHRYFTYNFVHVNYAHMMSNLFGLMMYSFPVYDVIGPDGLLMLFFAGGCVSALPSPLKDAQKESAVNKMGRVVESSVEKLPDLIANQLKDSPLSETAKLATRWSIERPRVMVGSSGSVYTVAGASLCCMAVDVYDTIQEIRDPENHSVSTVRRWARFHRLLCSAPAYLALVRTLSNEAMMVMDWLPRSDPWEVFADSMNMLDVALSAHVQGAIFGFSVMACVFYQKRSNAVSFQGRFRKLGRDPNVSKFT